MAKRNQSVRIIAGEWRGRLLPVLNKEGLRPTKDMVRETVFNWLQSHIADKRCLDCFAGTGALGFEAISRGAAELVLLEKDREIVSHLKTVYAEHGDGKNVRVIQQEAKQYLLTAEPFDLIFLDPPFALDLWQESLQAIVENKVLSDDGLIYIETARKLGLPQLPARLEYIKQKNSGQVSFALAAWCK